MLIKNLLKQKPIKLSFIIYYPVCINSSSGSNNNKMNLYNTINILGRGTFGYVFDPPLPSNSRLWGIYSSTAYLCEKKHNNQKLVVKRINIDLNDEVLKTAKNEVAILKSLNHPNIIQYYDSFAKNGVLHIVMEYATKGTVFDYILQNKPKQFTPQVNTI